MTKSTHGGAGRGQGRKANSERGLPPPLTKVLQIRLDYDTAEWIKQNGGSAFHRAILQAAKSAK